MPSRRSSESTHGATRRIVALVIIALQLAFVVGQVADARADVPTRSHVEREGVRLHYSHDSGQCVVCAIRQLSASPSDAQQLGTVATEDGEAATTAQRVPLRAPAHSPLHSRAPPVAT